MAIAEVAVRPARRGDRAPSVERREVWRFPAWHRPVLGAIVLIAIFMDFYQLGIGGFGNQYYATGVRSMLDSLHNFFFVSYDPGGFVTLDKPPLGFWLQVASAQLFGFTPFSVLLPQALAGVLSVLLLYHLVRRHFGVVAGLLAALALAVSPISVVTNRNNTIDSTLALILLGGAWAVMRAAETGRLRHLLLAAALVGLGFNVKMLEAYLVVPAFGLLYLLAAPHGWRQRIGHLAIAGALMLALSLAWVTAVDLVPAAQRPYVGSTQDNSELSLAVGYNGIDRLLGMFGRGRGGFGPPGGVARSATSTAASPSGPTGSLAGPGNPGGAPAFGGRPGPGGGGMFGTGTPGPLRLFQQELGGQIAWLLPAAILGAVALSWQRRPRVRSNRHQQSLVLWGTWLLTMGVFFSVAGFFHPYYLTEVAPAIAALFGIGAVTMWRDYRRGNWRGWLLPLALVATIAEQAHLLSAYPTWGRWLIPFLAIAGGLAVVVLVGARVATDVRVGRGRARPLAVLVAIALLALLVAPAIWAGIPVVRAEAAQLPTAGPAQTGGFRGGEGDRGASANVGLVSYLEAHRGNATYLVAVASSNQADALILATNQPVMALGGFTGSDPILTTDKLARLVASSAVRYALVSSGGFGPGGGQQSSLTQWIVAHGTAVPSGEWQGTSVTGAGFEFGGSQQLYLLGAS